MRKEIRPVVRKIATEILENSGEAIALDVAQRLGVVGVMGDTDFRQIVKDETNTVIRTIREMPE